MIQCAFEAISNWSENATTVQYLIHQIYLRKSTTKPLQSRASSGKETICTEWSY